MALAQRSMMGDSPYGHAAGAPMECISRAIELRKEPVTDAKTGAETYKVGFKIGGGIDQDPTKSPYNYPDTGIYITYVEADSPADKAGLKQHDKILQVNGYDLTVVTHDKAVKRIKKDEILLMLIARSHVLPAPEPDEQSINSPE